MPTDVYEQQVKAYKEDSRYACQFGIKCYQKNPAHHSRYKHPPKREQDVPKKVEEPVVTGRKRSSSDRDDAATGSSNLPQAKLRKDDETLKEAVAAHSISPSPPSKDVTKNSDSESESSEPSPKKDSPTVDESKSSAENGDASATSPETKKAEAINEDKKAETEDFGSPDEESTDPKKIIYDLFFVKMPEDFYKFYDFCTLVSSKDPCNALKLADLKLVGAYDVLGGKITTNRQEEPEKFLRHWRYYYDPPEFQTILKGSDKEGLHYGYWRDEDKDLPVFVGKNSANNDCKIVAVAPNIFGAVASYLDERRKKASPFEAVPLEKLSKQLKAFATENGISLSTDSPEMRSREKTVVARTFHGAGIVVPYDKKTQLGYRDLAATDSHLRKMVKKIDEAESDEERKALMSGIEEIVRLATIAADECDFGTCLELGHDLFSSGVEHLQKTGLLMLGTAYNLLHREKFLKIAQAHAKDRKKGCDLSVL